MAEQSQISWTESTWNPWHGCIKISPGCKNCYMYRDKERYGQDPRKIVRSKTTFNDPLKWKEPRMVFTCSWSDFFIQEADEWRGAAWDIIRNTPQHTYQILTKRPERIADHLPSDWGNGYSNVWLGVSCENQETADERIPILLNTPAAVHWVSAEPLLSPISFRWAKWDMWKPNSRRLNRPGEEGRDGMGASINELDGLRMLDWIVFGGESGPDFRAMNIDGLRAGVEQCKAANVRVFTKQDSGPRPGLQGRIPNELWLKEFPRAA